MLISLGMAVLCRIHLQLLFSNFAQALVVGTVGVVADPWLTSAYATERAATRRRSLACYLSFGSLSASSPVAPEAFLG